MWYMLYPWRCFPGKFELMLYQQCTIGNNVLDIDYRKISSPSQHDKKEREWKELLTGTSALKIQHLSQKQLASRLLLCSFTSNRPLSAVNEGNQKKISKDEKSPVKHFLEWKSPIEEAIWPEASVLHVLENRTNLFKFKPGTNWCQSHKR